MRTSTFATIFCLTIFGMSGAAQACRTSGVTGVLGQVVDSRMSLQQGTSCFIRNFTTESGGVGSRRFPSTNLRVTSKPSSGRVSISGSRVVYAARAGYRGNGSFVYRMQLKSGRIYDYRVNVEVY